MSGNHVNIMGIIRVSQDEERFHPSMWFILVSTGLAHVLIHATIKVPELKKRKTLSSQSS